MRDKHSTKFPFSGELTRLRGLRLKQNSLQKRKLGSMLGSGFFAKNTLWVARNLIGKYLSRRLPSGKVIKARITETECYKGFDDKASHAHKGRTQRTEVMFGQPGTIYVYLIYGMYHCLNLVCEKKNYPAAVLIRGVESVNGPGRVCKYFQVDRRLNGQKLGKELWIEDRGAKVSNSPTSPKLRGASKIQVTRRIGVDYAGQSKDRLWRFVLIN